MTPYLSCDETVLRLHYTLAALPGGLRNTVAAWMREHGINPDTIAEQTAIVRDPVRGSLSWTTVAADGARTEHLRYGSVAPDQWPAPFPARLHTNARDNTARSVRLVEEPAAPQATG